MISFPITEVRIAGVLAGILVVIFFARATITMKTSWRVGILEEKIEGLKIHFGDTSH